MSKHIWDQIGDEDFEYHQLYDWIADGESSIKVYRKAGITFVDDGTELTCTDINVRGVYLDKIKLGYSISPPSHHKFIDPMRGTKYEEGKISKWPVATQPYIPGVRMLAMSSTFVMTKLSKRLAVSSPLIENEIRTFSYYLPPNSVVDGKLNVEDCSLTTDQVASIIKKTPNSPPLVYHIFDIIYEPVGDLTAVAEERLSILRSAFLNFQADNQFQHIKVVDHTMVTSEEELVNSRDHSVETGHPGIVIRSLALDHPPESTKYNMSLYKSGVSSRVVDLLS